MGPRVPLYVVSPWSRGGWVDSEVFDHTSIAQFLERRFGITVPTIAPWNRSVSGDLTSAFDFTSPDPAFPMLPDTHPYKDLEARQKRMPDAAPPARGSPDFRQEPGTRPSRRTPYELHVHAQVDGKGSVSLELVNTGRRGAVFHVYDKKHLDRIPRRYTVEAGKTLVDSAWRESSTGRGYDLAVYSTNGFVRTFAGSAIGGTQLDVRVCYDPGHNAVRVELRNLGKNAVEAKIIANAYRGDGPWFLFLAPGQSGARTFDVSESGNWYDFTLVAPAFERRFAGRMENGANLISDPAGW
jgi:phospholipase C